MTSIHGTLRIACILSGQKQISWLITIGKLFNKRIVPTNISDLLEQIDIRGNVSSIYLRSRKRSQTFQMRVLLFLLSLIVVEVVADDVDVCEMTACQALEQSQIHLREFADSLEDDNVNGHITRLERRLRALEQPGMYNLLTVSCVICL